MLQPLVKTVRAKCSVTMFQIKNSVHNIRFENWTTFHVKQDGLFGNFWQNTRQHALKPSDLAGMILADFSILKVKIHTKKS